MAGEGDNDDIRSLLQGAMDGKISSEGAAGTAASLDVGEAVGGATDALPAAGSGEQAGRAVPIEQAAPAGDARQRDDQGRFVAKEASQDKTRETLTLKPAAQPQQAGEQLPQAKQPVPPPAWFKGAGKVDWNKMPDPVRAELSAFVQGLETERADVAPLKEMIDLARPMLVREAGSVHEGIRQLLAFHQLSIDKPLELIQHIAQSRRIDLRALFGGQSFQNDSQPQQQQPRSVIPPELQQRIDALEAALGQREDQQHSNTIQAFAADPAHPYFNDVRTHMGHLLKTGQAKTLDEAYDQATWASPVIRQQLLSQQAEDTAKTRAAEVAAAQAANRASLSGSPTMGATSVNGESDGSIRGDLLAAMRQHQGAV